MRAVREQKIEARRDLPVKSSAVIIRRVLRNRNTPQNIQTKTKGGDNTQSGRVKTGSTAMNLGKHQNKQRQRNTEITYEQNNQISLSNQSRNQIGRRGIKHNRSAIKGISAMPQSWE